MNFPAWLFDVYPVPEGVIVWFIGLNGERRSCLYPMVPSFFLAADEAGEQNERALRRIAAKAPAHVTIGTARKKNIYSNEWIDLFEVHVHDALLFKKTVAYFEKFYPYFAFFNSDLLVAQIFLYRTRLFPLGFGDYEINDAGELTAWTVRDDRHAVEYALPPFSIMTIRCAVSFAPARYQRTLELEVGYDGNTFALEYQSDAGTIEGINYHITRCDPDIILTEHGDSLLMPRITEAARRARIPMTLNRDINAGYKTSKATSFFQYGKVVHRDGTFELRGRWHVDAQNSVTIAEADLPGLFEICRVTQLCPQHQARASIGTGLSSLQLGWAFEHDYLIPARKREPEEFKSGSLLLLADRGGLIYNPPVGFHEQIAELDFVSMYPSIMVKQNVSPETVNCTCCNNQRVPELAYTICEQREGIVPATLRHVVKRRSYYKRKRKEMKGHNDALYRLYDCRQNVLKWMLVSCFGYLGYKNARFGKIEAHEAVNAFSRDILLTAKEIAEADGYELIHGIIDCMWLRKPGATEDDYQRLCEKIGVATKIDISLEGLYQWLLFPSSKVDGEMSTGTRYVGAYRHGEMKLRGIEARRRDTPAFIKKMQNAMLERMQKEQNIDGIRAIVPELLAIAHESIDAIRRGVAPPLELVLRRSISKEASEYTTNGVSAIVARMLEESSIHLSAGESISYIMIDSTGKKKPEKAKPVALYALEDGYDADFYSDLAFKAVETLLSPFGYTVERLNTMYNPPKPRPVKIPARKTGLRKNKVVASNQLSLF